MISKFPKEIEDFANQFHAMQIKRHQADYDPDASFLKSEVVQDILTVERTIGAFKKVSPKDRRAFAAYVLFRPRRKE